MFFKTFYFFLLFKICTCKDPPLIGNDDCCYVPIDVENKNIIYTLYNSHNINGKVITGYDSSMTKNTEITILMEGSLRNHSWPLKNSGMIANYIDLHPLGDVIYLDWCYYFDLTRQLSKHAVCYMSGVARQLAKLLVNLNLNGKTYGKMHLVGYDLGAHVAGLTGKYVEDMTGKKIARITGLDPSKDCFSSQWVQKNQMLNRDDAAYVQVLHTSDVLGHFYPLGTIDFYINGGKEQPSCEDAPTWSEAENCEHEKAVEIWNLVLTGTEFIGTHCPFDAFDFDSCDNVKISDSPETNHRGSYYVNSLY